MWLARPREGCSAPRGACCGAHLPNEPPIMRRIAKAAEAMSLCFQLEARSPHEGFVFFDNGRRGAGRICVVVTIRKLSPEENAIAKAVILHRGGTAALCHQREAPEDVALSSSATSSCTSATTRRGRGTSTPCARWPRRASAPSSKAARRRWRASRTVTACSTSRRPTSRRRPAPSRPRSARCGSARSSSPPRARPWRWSSAATPTRTCGRPSGCGSAATPPCGPTPPTAPASRPSTPSTCA